MFLNICIILQSLFFPWLNNEHYQTPTLEKLNTRINTDAYDETNPVVSKDGLTIYFTRVGHPDFNRTLMDDNTDLSATLSFADYQQELSSIYQTLSGRPVRDISQNSFNQDIWIATWAGGDFNNIEHPDYPLNSALPNSICSLTPDPDKFIIVNEFYKDGSMYRGFSTIQDLGNGNWSFPKPLFIYDYFTQGNEVNLTMDEDGRIIIMSLKRPSGKGDNDLYVSMKVADNLYSTPLPLNGVINTAYRESTPFISRDGQFLYFSSNRPGGYAGNYIYVSRRLDETWQNWSEPALLPKPINSESDDSQPFVNEASGYIYFTSRRDGTSDIFRTSFHPVKEEERKKLLIVHVVNALTGQPLDAKIALGKQKDGFFTRTIEAKTGKANYSFVEEDNLIMKPKKSGYKAEKVEVNLPEMYKDDATISEITLYMDPEGDSERFTLDNIYFVQSMAIIKDESYPVLDRIIPIFKRRPDLKITIYGHTDNIGRENDLVELSQQRADAIKNYLVQKGGIAADRIKTVGKGRSMPVNDNSTEEKRAKNRRVEFAVYK